MQVKILRVARLPKTQTWLFGVLAFVVPIFTATYKFNFKPGSFSTPLYFFGDEFFGANWVYTLLHSFSLVNHTFGFPLGQDFNFAFVSQDTLPHLFAAFIAMVKDNVYFGLNVYMLLTFGLAGLGMFVGAKIIGAGNIESFIFGLVFSLLPEHFANSTQSLDIISYYLIPISIAVLVLKILHRESRIPLLDTRKRNLLWLSFCVLNGALYSYYSIGLILIFGTLALIVAISDGSIRALKAIIGSLALNVFGFLLVSIPSLLNVGRTTGGINYYHGRSWQAAYANSGSLIQTINPRPGTLSYRFLSALHGNWIATYDQLSAQINSLGYFQEGWIYTIPLALLILYFLVLAFQGKLLQSKMGNWPLELNPAVALLGSIALISLLWMWAGGLGTFFAMFVNQTLRGYARFSVFATSALALACAIGLTRLRKTKISQFPIIKIAAIFCAVLLVADGFTVSISSQTSATRDDVVAIDRMLTHIPLNCAVLEFPVVHFPYESPGWPSYALMAPGLAGNRPDIKWSAGAVGGSPGWAFIQKFRTYQDSPSKALFNAAKASGFCAILVDSHVWKTFYDFQPVPSYQRVPAVPLDNFLKVFGNGMKLSTPVDTYYLYRL